MRPAIDISLLWSERRHNLRCGIHRRGEVTSPDGLGNPPPADLTFPFPSSRFLFSLASLRPCVKYSSCFQSCESFNPANPDSDNIFRLIRLIRDSDNNLPVFNPANPLILRILIQTISLKNLKPATCPYRFIQRIITGDLPINSFFWREPKNPAIRVKFFTKNS